MCCLRKLFCCPISPIVPAYATPRTPPNTPMNRPTLPIDRRIIQIQLEAERERKDRNYEI